jgi:hypothetical protein
MIILPEDFYLCVLNVSTVKVDINDSSLRNHFPQIIPVGFPPVEQNREVGSDAKMTDTEVKIIFGLIDAVDLGPWRHPQFECRFKDPAFDSFYLR